MPRSRPIWGWTVQELRRAWLAHGGFIVLHFPSNSTWQPTRAAARTCAQLTQHSRAWSPFPSQLLYRLHHASLPIPDHQLHIVLLIVLSRIFGAINSEPYLREMVTSSMLSRTGCLQTVAGLPSLGASQVRSSNAGQALLARMKINAPLPQLEKRTLVVSAQRDTDTPLVSDCFLRASLTFYFEMLFWPLQD